jgi:tetratricopeptide (TPR) repeat protein
MFRSHLNFVMRAKQQIFLLTLISFLLVLWGCSDSSREGRPEDLVIDEVGILGAVSESAERSLSHIRQDYGIEVVLAVVKSTGDRETLQEMAARLFTEWDVGRKYDGRGLLLLISDGEKEVRIEVGLALEGIFTDLFTGYIEDRQLKSYYLSGQLEIGLVAILEEIEARSNLMSLDEASVDRINALDLAFLSSGGGADVDLKDYGKERVANYGQNYPAGQTPHQAWQTLIQSWRDKNRNPDIGVYTPVTRLIYRAFINQPDSRFEEDVGTWGKKSYEIIKNDKYAVVFFGTIKGWDNAPFLFCKTAEGWQFDMVNQRKIVRMGPAPRWGIERGEHPYIHLLSRCPYWMGQDIPLRDEDRYRLEEDNTTVSRIVALEQQMKQNSDDFRILLELGMLYTRTSMGQKRITLLTKADGLQTDHPDVIRSLAIAHVDAHYQYKTALNLMDRYVDLRPQDSFGHFYRGYLQLMENQPGKAIQSLEKGLSLEPANIYGRCKLARAYQNRGEKGDHSRALGILENLEMTHPGHIRVSWLKHSLE